MHDEGSDLRVDIDELCHGYVMHDKGADLRVPIDELLYHVYVMHDVGRPNARQTQKLKSNLMPKIENNAHKPSPISLLFDCFCYK